MRFAAIATLFAATEAIKIRHSVTPKPAFLQTMTKEGECTEGDVAMAKAIFEHVDTDNSGSITCKEGQAALDWMEENYKEMLEGMKEGFLEAAGDDETLTRAEFEAAMEEHKEHLSEDEITAITHLVASMDTNGDEQVTLAEAKAWADGIVADWENTKATLKEEFHKASGGDCELTAQEAQDYLRSHGCPV